MTTNAVAALGDAGLLLSLVAAAFAVSASIAGARRGARKLVRAGEYAAHASTAFLTFSSAVLFFQLLASDYSIKYVQRHSEASMPWYYRLTAFWGGLDGSIMWWVLLLAIFASVAIYVNRERHRELIPYVTAILYVVVSFFLLLIIFEKRPFEVFLTAVPHSGSGMNPLLQNPYMATHPPSLYLGFVSATVPFAFGLAALITGNLDDSWIQSTRRWTLVSWYFLSQGLILGSLWAYEELGWGGYWGWDPVENAGFLPWLTATAFLHSIMIQERRGMLKVWNISLVILTFLLTIIGTFMTRSGVVQSVHAFGQDTKLAIIFLSFIGFVAVFSYGFMIYRLPLLRSRAELESWLSREFAFLANNWVLLSAAFFVLVATLFPTISEAVTGERITVGPPFFNKWMTPIGLILLFLMGVGPLIAWRKASVENLKQQFAVPVIAGVLTVGVCLSFQSLRVLTPLFNDGIHLPVAAICFGLCAFTLATIVQEFFRGALVRQRHTKLDLFTAMIGLVGRNKKRYGGYVVHLGVVLMFIGFAGDAFKKETDATLQKGESVTLGRFAVRYDGFTTKQDAEKSMLHALVTVTRDGEPFARMSPGKWAYKKHEDEPTTEVDIKRMIGGDLYIVLNGYDLKAGIVNLKVVINPLVDWIWIGFILLAIGTVIAFLPDRAYALAAKEDKSKAAAAAALILCMLASPAVLAQAPEGHSKPLGGQAFARNDMERKLFSEIVCMCGTCGRQVLSECSCSFAHKMRATIQEMLDAGKTREDVIAYELATYPGQSALVEPIDKGFNRLAWAVPLGAILLAAGGLGVAARKWTARARTKQAGPGPGEAIDAEYAAKLDDELDELD